jgi:hypothetical protein
MLKSKDFWAGVVVGAILLYLYQNHLKGMGSGGK